MCPYLSISAVLMPDLFFTLNEECKLFFMCSLYLLQLIIITFYVNDTKICWGMKPDHFCSHIYDIASKAFKTLPNSTNV